MSFVDCQPGGLAIGGYEGEYYGKQSDICGKTVPSVESPISLYHDDCKRYYNS